MYSDIIEIPLNFIVLIPIVAEMETIFIFILGIEYLLYKYELIQSRYSIYIIIVLNLIKGYFYGSPNAWLSSYKNLVLTFSYPLFMLKFIDSILVFFFIIGVIILAILALYIYINITEGFRTSMIEGLGLKFIIFISIAIVLLIIYSTILGIYPIVLIFAGIYIPLASLLAYVLANTGLILIFARAVKNSLRNVNRRINVRGLKLFIILYLITLVVIPSIGFGVHYGLAKIEIDGGNELLNNIEYTYNISEVPIKVDNLRLIDRSLARDFFSTFSLPASPKGWFLEKLLDYECIGIVDGKPAWILPFKYQTVFGEAKDTNKIAGFMWIYLTDTPLPENIKYEFYEMDIGFGLEGFRDLYTWLKIRYPQYILGEWYIIKDKDGWGWVLLLDKIEYSYQETVKIVIVRSFYEYEELSPEEALKKGIPQVISTSSLKQKLSLLSKYLRNGRIDPTASGVYLMVPKSPDLLYFIDQSFYERPHHFLLGDNWFGRDFYMYVKPAEYMQSVVLITMINNSIKIIDLRGYKRGQLQGVSLPTEVLSVLRDVADEEIGIGIVNVRYPKLYALEVDNETVLTWIALLVEEVAGGDILRGVAFVDAVNMRIKGFIQYTLGEERSIFIERIKQYISLTYKSFTSGENETSVTIREGRIINGTILAKGWVLEGSGSNLEFTLTFRIDNNTNIVVAIAKEQFMESKEQWYLVSTLEVGERVNMKLRFDPERQVWVIYHVDILS